MPSKSHLAETKKADGSPSQKLVVEFTNGSLEQLFELGKFFKVDGSNKDPYKVLELAIGILETIKEKTPSSDTSPKE